MGSQPPEDPPEVPEDPPPDPILYGGGGGGGAGVPPGNGGIGAAFGSTGTTTLGGSGGSVSLPGRNGGAGGNLGFAGAAGINGTFRLGSSGGLAGGTGPAGVTGPRGVAILGNTNINFVNGGVIDGTQKTGYDFSVPLEEVRYITHVTSDLTTITIPSTGVQAGDIAFLFDRAGTTSVTPTGFTSIASVLSTFSTYRVNVSYKILVSGDLGAVATGMSGGAVTSKTLIIFRPNVPITSLQFSTINSEATIGNPTLQNLSMSGIVVPILAFVTYNGTTSAPSVTENGGTFTSNLSGGIYTQVKYLRYIKGSTPVNSTVDMGDAGTNIMISFFVNFT
jgi:hypothetical protein